MKKNYGIFALIVIIISALLSSCSSAKDELQEEFSNSVKAGLQARWDITSADYNSLEEEKDIIEKGVHAELDAVLTYNDADFEDDDFEAIAKAYIGAVQAQADAMEYYFTDNEQFNTLFFDKGYDVRRESINKLVSDYGFTVDEGYEENLKNLSEVTDVGRLSLGETIDAESASGNVSVCIDKAEVIERYDGSELSNVDKGTKIVGIKAVIKNTDYSNGYDNYINAEDFMYVETEDGITAAVWEYGDQYEGYGFAGSAYFECDQGKKVKVALPYIVDEDCKMVKVCILPGYTLMAPIE